MAGVGGVLVIALAAVIVLFLLIWIAASRYRKVGPNTALIVFGQGKPRVIATGPPVGCRPHFAPRTNPRDASVS